MARAFIFPGQGSQFVGMGKALAKQCPEARAIFEEVDDSLEQELSRIMFEGPEEALTLTANTQPALMAVSIAVLRVLEIQGLVLEDKIRYVAGHSLGEYSALCAAGMFSLRDTARLLRIRGNAMQEAVPVGVGAMAAIIGLDNSIVSAICQEVVALGVCQISNDNGSGQLVVSGNREAVERTVSIARKRGARHVIMLPVSAPFHSKLMESAAEIMNAVLDGISHHNPKIPVISNVLAEPVQSAVKIKNLLVEQITGRVRWRETIEWFAAHDIMDLYEIGSGRVLTGLAKRVNRDFNGMAVGTVKEIEIALKALGI